MPLTLIDYVNFSSCSWFSKVKKDKLHSFLENRMLTYIYVTLRKCASNTVFLLSIKYVKIIFLDIVHLGISLQQIYCSNIKFSPWTKPVQLYQWYLLLTWCRKFHEKFGAERACSWVSLAYTLIPFESLVRDPDVTLEQEFCSSDQ